jgi:hypothetical protein
LANAIVGIAVRKFLQFLDTIEASVPPDLDVHLILDNYGTYETPRVRRWFVRHPRFHLHFTPTSPPETKSLGETPHV